MCSVNIWHMYKNLSVACFSLRSHTSDRFRQQEILQTSHLFIYVSVAWSSTLTHATMQLIACAVMYSVFFLCVHWYVLLSFSHEVRVAKWNSAFLMDQSMLLRSQYHQVAACESSLEALDEWERLRHWTRPCDIQFMSGTLVYATHSCDSWIPNGVWKHDVQRRTHSILSRSSPLSTWM